MKKLFAIFTLTFLFALASCAVRYVYSTYDDARVMHEDEDVRIESVLFPTYDYSAPYGYRFPNKILVHYRNSFDFSLKIEDKTLNLEKVVFKKAVICKNDVEEYPLLDRYVGRIYMNATKIVENGEVTTAISEDSLLRYSHELFFKKEGEGERKAMSFYFEVPVDYKRDSTVYINLEIKLVFADGSEKTVFQTIGGERCEISN